MTSALKHYFGFGTSATQANGAESAKVNPVRALPASWFTTEEMYQFERRAIFSRRWLFTTHSSRIKKAGDFLRLNIAGFDIVINRDRQGNARAFHNACRHRAYPVVEKQEGNAKIFSCRYHGWSYGLDGHLAKAPGYPTLGELPNGLLPVHVKTDINGFIWINMDANDVPEVPWEEHFDNVDKQERYKDFDFDNYDLDHVNELDAGYNWKVAADNFNECYHCPTTHPDIPSMINLETFDSAVKDGHIQHYCAPCDKQVVTAASTYYFPNTSMTVSPHFLMIQKFLPTGPSTTKVHYEIYRNRHSSDEDFHLIADMYARVMGEDKVLCNAVQKNLETGVYVSGLMHPKFEKAPIFFQGTVRQVISEHYRKEKAEGREIWPAQQKVAESDLSCQQDMEICKALTQNTQREVLAW